MLPLSTFLELQRQRIQRCDWVPRQRVTVAAPVSIAHGTLEGYRGGCRCLECRGAESAERQRISDHRRNKRVQSKRQQQIASGLCGYCSTPRNLYARRCDACELSRQARRRIVSGDKPWQEGGPGRPPKRRHLSSHHPVVQASLFHEATR